MWKQSTLFMLWNLGQERSHHGRHHLTGYDSEGSAI
jgi:hypothetical protein